MDLGRAVPDREALMQILTTASSEAAARIIRLVGWKELQRAIDTNGSHEFERRYQESAATTDRK